MSCYPLRDKYVPMYCWNAFRAQRVCLLDLQSSSKSFPECSSPSGNHSQNSLDALDWHTSHKWASFGFVFVKPVFMNPSVQFLWIWVRSRNCSCLVTWFCYQLIAKPGNKTAIVSWPDPYTLGHLCICWWPSCVSCRHNYDYNIYGIF